MQLIQEIINNPEALLDPLIALLYVGVGLAAIWYYDQWMEKKVNKGINSIFLVLAFMWGVSGFFIVLEFFDFLTIVITFVKRKFLNFNFSVKLPDLISSHIYQLFYLPIPDWDIFANSLTDDRYSFFEHRSFLFSSIILPSLVLLISYILSKFIKNSWRWAVNILRNFSLGLFLGISVHLILDILVYFLNKLLVIISSSVSMDIKVNGFSHTASWLWLIINIFLGLLIPTIVIWKNNSLLDFNTTKQN